ncbi:MAG: Rhomboid protease GluP [Syntrophorhabdaceae bacterium PtaU1.Bin034]|nr:MAG: Rhomboid protease GluP [Syntrophorhabdaceae bacterium PtaU1.Bin034]
MIPLKDNVPTRTFPIITITLFVVNTLVFLWSLTLSEGSEQSLVYRYALIPKELLVSFTSKPELLPYNFLTIFTSMFLHGGFLHIIGNMMYLWVFGNNVEDSIGHFRFLVFYLVSGLVAALVQFSFDPTSHIPMIGASGAVSGVLGAYLLLFPKARVKTLIFIFIFITTVEIPAMVLLTVWFFLQIIFSHGQGVAWFAHIGGFVFGLLAIKIFALGRKGRARSTK